MSSLEKAKLIINNKKNSSQLTAEKNMNKKYVFAIIGLLVGGLVWFSWPKAQKTEGAILAGPVDLIGSRVGTTTTGVYFSSFNVASTSAITRINGADEVMFTLLATKASTTPGGSVRLSFLGSNDYDCDTATTTTIYNKVIMSDINWYDIGGLAGSQTVPTGTSTLVWVPSAAGQAETITLENEKLNFTCIKAVVSASSTELYMTSKTKIY